MSESVIDLLERNGVIVDGKADWPNRLGRFLKTINPLKPRPASVMFRQAYSNYPAGDACGNGAFFEHLVALIMLEHGISPIAMGVNFKGRVPDPMDIVIAWEEEDGVTRRAVFECKRTLRERWKTVALSLQCLIRHPAIYPPGSAYYLVCGELRESTVNSALNCKKTFFDPYRIPFLDDAVTIATPRSDKLFTNLAGRKFVSPLIPGRIEGRLLSLREGHLL
jgi:hypothetical protein